MVSVGLDGHHLERFDFTAIDIGWTVCHLAIHKRGVDMELEYCQFSAHLVAELHRFCDGKNAGDVRCLATFTVSIVAGCCFVDLLLGFRI